MKIVLTILSAVAIISGCSRKADPANPVNISNNCNIQAVYAANALKVSITAGIWGTVSSMEGDCMPTVPPATNTCTHCAVKRTVKVYAYTHISQATPLPGRGGFYSSLSTPLVAETTTDDNGFFQLNLPPGTYSVFVMENGNLYASSMDGSGGINPVTVTAGPQKTDQRMTYKAVF